MGIRAMANDLGWIAYDDLDLPVQQAEMPQHADPGPSLLAKEYGIVRQLHDSGQTGKPNQ